ncbi:MAG: hypothetical protein HRT35_34295 [Algicola sp.]|nr:hypothetical protein [Algicola sp.]
MTTQNSIQQDKSIACITKPVYPKVLTILLYMCVPVFIGAVGMILYLNSGSGIVASNVSINDKNPLNANTRTPQLTVSESKVPESTLYFVERRLRVKFMAGDWRYGGIEQRDGIVRAYIQIPQRLDLNSDQHSQYIRQSLCPGGIDEIWTQLSPKQLEIHLYTRMKSQSVYALCG